MAPAGIIAALEAQQTDFGQECRGVVYVDVHLLAAAAIDQCQFWTLDKRLNAVAASIGIVVNS
jgi:hypothetical protein